jgi:4-hydroxy-tetrahydrodipicolinate synthase
MVKLVSAARKGDWNTARKLHYELLPLFKAIFIETNPIPIKAAMAMKGLITESYRLPMCSMAPRNRETLAATLKELRIA